MKSFILGFVLQTEVIPDQGFPQKPEVTRSGKRKEGPFSGNQAYVTR